MTNNPSDENWREEMERYVTNENHLKLLREGPKSFSQAMLLNGLKQQWKKHVGWVEPEPVDCQSNFQEWNAQTKSL